MGVGSDGTRGVAMQRLEGDRPLFATRLSGGFNCSQAGGISQNGICCLKSCGACSGDGCSRKNGGARGCCSGEIKRQCSATVGAPCRMSGGWTITTVDGAGRHCEQDVANV